ncbi:CaiB/BaiF CoA transferase family protein [Rugamonas sp. DEMB1]|uniref:CaiB/BaiF CoA transferase family protein n=1 Tax=Rugamonas sp. DEMB1 TaxID=3039386 RepID=UPI00244A22F4|nr:CaiB/BaiF CoA-transferase family protein [Rugamonas sp. DEMB1]WGG52204.1 CaiB/BaiF CoA-transferase family protein [Rugamonas sp. DEMB1]
MPPSASTPQSPDQPLAGIRVLDLTRLLPGPVATMHLAEMGAEVIKIEDPGAGDYARAMGPVRAEVSQFFVAVNRGKQFLRMDLKDSAQRERLLEMVDTADVLVESFRPGVMDKLGLGWQALRQRNPRLVMCAISGYGQDGPYAALAGHDINYIGYAGMLDQNAGDDGRPALPNLQVGDLLGGAQSALQGILAALLAVKMGGVGRFVDVSMTDAVLAHNIMPLVGVNNGAPAQPGRDLLTGGVPCYTVYKTSDARYMAVGALELKFWQACCDVLGRPDLKTRHWQLGQRVGGADAMALRAELDAVFAGRTQAEWSALFGAADCCVTPVLRTAEALEHPLFRARGMARRAVHPSEGEHWALAQPVKFRL